MLNKRTYPQILWKSLISRKKVDKNTLPNYEKTSSRALVIVLFCFFILNQFYSIYFRWYNHMGPTGLGDSDYYISRIAYYKDHGIFTKAKLFDVVDKQAGLISTESSKSNDTKYFYMFNGFTSSLLLGKLSALLNISAEKMFHYNFYLGIFISGLVLYLIMRNFGTYPLNVLVAYFIFAFYTGSGSYHGFFWVAASFYCIVFWLLAIWVLYFSNHWKIYTPPAVLLLLFSHTLSIFCIGVMGTTIILNGLMSKDLVRSLKKAGFLVLLFIIYFGGYKLLLYKGLTLPLFGEYLGFDEMLSFDFKGFNALWAHTPFATYFAGWLVPLTAGSMFFCIIRKEYKLLSLFISAFLGTIVFCSVHLRGMRAFLYLEAVVLFVIIYGIQQSLLLIWNNRHEILKPKQLSFRSKSIFLANGIFLLFGCGFTLFLLATRISVDFGQKFYHPRYWQSEPMDSFVKGSDKARHIFYLGSSYKASSFLSLDGWWDKEVYTPSMVPSKVDISFFEKFLFVGDNYKIYSSQREGIGVFWPTAGRIVLNTTELSPGDYSITFSDTAFTPEILDQIFLEIQKNGVLKNITVTRRKESVTIKYPMENIYPPLMLPWYSLAAKYAEKIKPGRLTIRETFLYTMDFTLTEKIKYIYLNNQGDTLNLVGNINILLNQQKQAAFTLDLDWGKTESLCTKAKLLFQGKNYPLLWADPRFKLEDNLSSDKLSKIVFELEGNFGDVKVFSLCKKFL